MARFPIRGYGGVGADDLFGFRGAGFGVCDGEGGGEGDVLADGEAEDGCGGGECEAVDGCVVGDDGFGGEGEGLVGCWVEGFAFFWFEGWVVSGGLVEGGDGRGIYGWCRIGSRLVLRQRGRREECMRF